GHEAWQVQPGSYAAWRLSRSVVDHTPFQCLAGGQRHQCRLAIRKFVRYGLLRALQRQCPGIARQAIEVGTMETCKALQRLQATRTVEGQRIQLHGMQGRIAACAAASVLFEPPGVRSAVGSKEESWAAADCRLHQRCAMGFSLEYGQAVPMRTHAAGKEGVAVVQQVMRGDRGSNRTLCIANVVGAFPGRDVLENHL